MDNLKDKNQHILIVGNDKSAISICVCLLMAGHPVTLLNTNSSDAEILFFRHVKDVNELTENSVNIDKLTIVRNLDILLPYNMAIAVTNENLEEKTAVIKMLENSLSADTLIAINTESILLSSLQNNARNPERLIGANWVEPVHTTCFLEIITNHLANTKLVDHFYQTAKNLWQKDPYVLKCGYSVRARMLCALIREAFYLIENDYVTIEDIDRACRNDAGYYLPFAGNFRYMDLMGGYMYGIVMQDLNPELSRSTHIPTFYQEMINNDSKGMINNRGFYNYEPGEAKHWDETFRKFSYQIQHIISKYPFSDVAEKVSANI